ncbi:dnaJ homolog subfamily B member 1-like [Dunckerocampus dactyliophorus]|uniref:dnaJ homolog subfamily B member 1-like n=1 Tax=Dunckerocampus dactyliophorus TaxID=161453 RepID=UPI0024074FA1|nr:dnaJ homolog subfamily B member 1-like [Dunckerocampus dactyliophorus]
MVEVVHKLSCGVCRLSSFIYSQGRPVCPGEVSGTRCAKVNFSSIRNNDNSKSNDNDIEPKRIRAEPKIELSRVSSYQVNQICLYNTDLDGNSSCFIGFLQTKTFQGFTAFSCLSAELLPIRRTSWSRDVISGHLASCKSPHQRRAFCTVIFIQVTQESERRHCSLLCLSKSRSYSRTSDTKDVPLYRNRTAYYDILKVSPNATQSQIKTAYYKQCLVYHPDKNPGNKESIQRFSEISEAYTVLGNHNLRRKYDRGILSMSDVQDAGRPTSKDIPKSRGFSQTGRRPMFDFDAFYQAHYGEQLQKEREMRARRQRAEEMSKKMHKQRQSNMIEFTAVAMMITAGLIVIQLCNKP